jgi:hypothetical protein
VRLDHLLPRFAKSSNSAKSPAKTSKPRLQEKRPVCGRSGTRACPIKWRPFRHLKVFREMRRNFRHANLP